MPIYNPGEEIILAINSILNQTYENWELLILDDGSKIKLQSILYFEDPRIKYFYYNENKGLYYRLNEAIEMSNGNFIARMDQDDISYPERISEQIKFLSNNPNVDLVSVRAISINEDNTPIGYIPIKNNHDEIISKPWKGFNLIHPTWLGKKAWFIKQNYENCYLSEDQIKLLKTFDSSTFHTINKVLFAYRLRSRFYLRKNIKTASAIFKEQIVYFLNKNIMLNILLSFLNYIKKIAGYFFVKIFFRKHYYNYIFSNEISKDDYMKYCSLVVKLSNFNQE